jgi:leader peptidase (prepilin peptidase) / N-methyltransferase
MNFAVHSTFVFILGAVFGSFFNVCIHRLPREQSIFWPPSHCTNCKKAIPFYLNVPLISFLLLKGRCHNCESSISVRYFLVELITAFVFLWIWYVLMWSMIMLIAVTLFSLLLVATAVDLEFQMIPDEVSLGGLFVGFLASSLYPLIHGEEIWYRGLIEAALGAALGGGLIYLTGVIGTFVFKKEAMGGGDVKLLAMLGAFIGWERTLFVFLAAPLLALPLGLYIKLSKRSELIPYGPFLSLAGWIAFFWGKPLIEWYWPGQVW